MPLHLGLQTSFNDVCVGSHSHLHQPIPTCKNDNGGHSGGKYGRCAPRGVGEWVWSPKMSGNVGIKREEGERERGEDFWHSELGLELES